MISSKFCSSCIGSSGSAISPPLMTGRPLSDRNCVSGIPASIEKSSTRRDSEPRSGSGSGSGTGSGSGSGTGALIAGISLEVALRFANCWFSASISLLRSPPPRPPRPPPRSSAPPLS